MYHPTQTIVSLQLKLSTNKLLINFLFQTVEEQACSTVYEEVCSEVAQQQCQTIPEEVCTEQLVEECNTVNDLRCEAVLDEQCETVEDEACTDEEVEECSEEETVCDTVESEECYTKYEDECETVYKERCSTEYELECTTGVYLCFSLKQFLIQYLASLPQNTWRPASQPTEETCYLPPMARMNQLEEQTARLYLSITVVMWPSPTVGKSQMSSAGK